MSELYARELFFMYNGTCGQSSLIALENSATAASFSSGSSVVWIFSISASISGLFVLVLLEEQPS